MINYNLLNIIRWSKFPHKYYETFKLAGDILLTNEPDIKINNDQLTRLFEFATAESNFPLGDKVYDQVGGVVTGSPLVPVLSNLFMGYHERLGWIIVIAQNI